MYMRRHAHEDDVEKDGVKVIHLICGARFYFHLKEYGQVLKGL